jgi:uncharacterized glyoxalase superfamily protein PhnB
VAGAVPYLSYADAPRAIDWLVQLGFSVVARQDDGGRVVHCELRLGDAVIMAGSDDADYTVAPLSGQSTGAGVYLVVDDVDGTFRRAVASGGTSVIEPEDTPWGSRRARVLDPAGREWTFGSYRPGGQEDPEDQGQ